MPLKWKCGGLTSGLQGKSQISFSWFCLGRLYISRNLSISSSLSTLLACNCLWDSVLSFRITVHGGCLENPRDGEPGRLPSVGSHRVGHDWSDLAAAVAAHIFKPGSEQIKIVVLGKINLQVEGYWKANNLEVQDGHKATAYLGKATLLGVGVEIWRIK